MLSWKFYLNGVQVSEPLKWDSVSFTLQRSDKFIGLENVYSDEITFDVDGGVILKNLFDVNGIDGECLLKIEGYCDGVLVQTINGVINLITYKEINNEVTVQIEDKSFIRTFKDRLDRKINLSHNTGVDGGAITNYSPFSLGLHSKAIIQSSELGAGEDIVVSQPIPALDLLGNINIPMVFDLLNNGLPDAFSYTSFYSVGAIGADSPDTLFEATIAGLHTINYDIKGIFNFTPQGAFTVRPSFNLVLAYRINGGATLIHSYGVFSIPAGVTLSTPLNQQATLNLNLNAGDKVSFYLAITGFAYTGTFSSDPVVSLTLNKGSFIKVKNETLANPSNANAYLIFDTFSKICESITGELGCFVSNYFSNGCGSFLSLTNGLNIRNMRDKNGKAFPISLSFMDLYEAIDCIYNIGLRIETVDGKNFIRVEPKEYFYNSTTIISFENVSDIQTEVAKDEFFNGIDIGYEKWNLNTPGVNGLDEFNTKHSYGLSIKNAKNKIQKVSKFITSGYLIEQTRRIQYLDNPITDFETDNDIFLIALNRDIITSNQYTIPPVDITYLPYRVSERDENFSGIANIVSPSTSYNLRLSPVRMAMNWFKTLAVSMFKKPTQIVKFISGEGNYFETDKENDACGNINPVTQNQDIQALDLQGIPSYPLYQPQYIRFQQPFGFNDFLSLISNSIYAIELSCNSGNFRKGYIKEVVFQPNEDGGIANFLLLEAACALGSFNNDFNDDFDTGNC